MAMAGFGFINVMKSVDRFVRSNGVSLVAKAPPPSLSPSSCFFMPLKRKGIGYQLQLYCCSISNNDSDKSCYLTLKDEELMRQCEMTRFKASGGPGGQHRNKRKSVVRLKHLPTGIVSQAVEDRSQHMNRASALARLRTLIALKEIPSLLNHTLLLPSFFKFLLGMQTLFDLIFAVEGSISDAAKFLGMSTGALSRLLLSDDSLWKAVNELRASKVLEAFLSTLLAQRGSPCADRSATDSRSPDSLRMSPSRH